MSKSDTTTPEVRISLTELIQLWHLSQSGSAYLHLLHELNGLLQNVYLLSESLRLKTKTEPDLRELSANLLTQAEASQLLLGQLRQIQQSGLQIRKVDLAAELRQLFDQHNTPARPFKSQFNLQPVVIYAYDKLLLPCLSNVISNLVRLSQNQSQAHFQIDLYQLENQVNLQFKLTLSKAQSSLNNHQLTNRHSGLGLGLFLSQMCLKHFLHGSQEIETIPHQRYQCWITLPLAAYSRLTRKPI